MASQQSTIDFILKQISEAGSVSAKKMFGEYGIFCDGKMVALVCDDKLFVKPTQAGRSWVGSCEEGIPYPGAKACFLISDEKLHDNKWLVDFLKITSEELPLPKKEEKTYKITINERGECYVSKEKNALKNGF